MKIINCIIYSLVSYIIIINDLLAQTTGDYRSTATSITWSNANDWQTWNGSNWVTASSAPGSGNDVYIQAGHTATLTGNQSCNSIFISTGTTDATNGGDGKVVLQSYTLNLSGKLSCYFGNIDITVNSTTPLSITPENTTPTLPISKSTGGLLKFIGNTRDLTVTGEWSGNATGSPTLFDIEISLNTGQVGTLYTVVKAANWLISSGTLETSQRISVDNNTTGQGNFTINTGATFSSTESGSGTTPVISRTTSAICGAITVNGTLKLGGLSPHLQCADINIGSNSIIEFNRSGNQNFISHSFANSDSLLDYYNIVLSGSGTKTTLPSRNTTLAANGSLTMGGGAFALGTSGNFTVSSTGTSLIYSGSSTQTATSSEWLSNFQNLTVNNSLGLSIGGLTRTINGILTLTLGTFTNGSNLTIGNGATIIRTGGLLNSAPNFGSSVSIIYNQNGNSISTGNEIPASTSVLYNLTINNSNGVILTASTTVNGTLTFTNGQLTTTSSNLLTIETSGSTSGYSNSSFVNGPIQKNTNNTSAFTFPTGKGNLLRSISVTPSNSNNTSYTAEYFNSTYSNTTSFTSPITRVSTVDYFVLSRSTTGAPSDAIIEMAWGSNSGVNTKNVGELTLSRFAGGNWVNESATGTGDSLLGSVTTNSAAASFGTFILANAATNTNLLPVKLIKFTSEFSNPEVNLFWSTVSEINSKSFEIEKSVNGKDFTYLDFVYSKAKGGLSNQLINYIFIDHHPNPGISYYRIKQIDFNGKCEYSPITISKVPELPNIKIIDKTLYVSNQGGDNNVIDIIELNGIVLLAINFVNSIEINLSFLSPGSYLCRINGLNPVRIIIK